ncbi:peptidoglycan DD-metalloendopeptidase family protein [Cytobacillus gottheilii]|uniref:Peptidoglycan DD-metalloendopeptidase family protein n=1 Tax=Cytobacillus gottheilii TaxID=859144 RepID=A0ABX8FAP0_9BACI|nr:peptidoglycan DD-metalloendopeptidase family protein [Cytobacillus gottheilii]QVY60207.1 peptidoglycan DD-metalloendopeptidase family protein [Cytobacillus gottheilii]
MKDYIKRLLIAGGLALCVSLLFLGGKTIKAETFNITNETTHWIWPADGVITDTFGTRNGKHKGIDIAADSGTPIYAVDQGTITKSYYSGSYGHVIFVKHKNGTETIYAHLQERLGEEGDEVEQGEVIGKMGSTGNSSGVHLHFEIHKHEWTYEKENALDPFLAFGPESLGDSVEVFGREDSAVNIRTAAVLNEFGSRGQNYDHESEEDENNSAKKTEEHESITHIVQSGETLWDISVQYKMDVISIQEANKLDSDHIEPEQSLIIPDIDPDKVYLVKRGDTLSSIAEEKNLTVQELKDLNMLNDDTIQINERIMISN